jgi:DNA-binding transcriptional ArsR family regulator
LNLDIRVGGYPLRKLLWYLIAGTRGGSTRALILKLLIDRPYNANQLTDAMSMDYKTIRHHLEVLVKNGVITVEGDKYGAMYFISKAMEANLDEFNQIWGKIDKQSKSR